MADCFIHCCGGKTEEEYKLKEKELTARSDELKIEQENSFKLSQNLQAETKAKNDEIAAKNREETAKKKAITKRHMEMMGKKITAVMKEQKTEQIGELHNEMQKLQQMMEEERVAHAAEKAALLDVQQKLESDKQGLEHWVRQFQSALARTGGESLRLCRELSDPNIAPWTDAEKQAGLASIISNDLSQSLRGPQWEGLAPPTAAAPAAAALTANLTTPMHQACLNGDKKAVKAILRDLAEQQKIDDCLSTKDHNGKTPLDICVASGHGDLHEYLVTKASVSPPPPTQLPPMDRTDSAVGIAPPSMGDAETVALPGAVVEEHVQS